MAKPMTPEQWLEALRAEGVTDIVEMPGWRTNNRNHIKAFTDVHATMIHHTAGEGPGVKTLVFQGTDDLPGPLCHDYLDRSGRLYLVGNGRANHAGTVAANAYAAVRDEKSTHPYPDAAEPLDGNSLSYGLECENSGAVGRTWPAKQYDVAVRVQAARCRFHGWTANSVWAHKEATRRKPVDPRLDMDDFRADVAERLTHEPGWNPGTETEEDPMAGITKKDIFDAVWRTDALAAPKDAADLKTNPNWQPQSILRDIQARVRANTAAEAAQTAAITALAKLVGSGVDTDAVVTAVREEIRDAVVKVSVDVTGADAA
jgi:hypothetical protein